MVKLKPLKGWGPEGRKRSAVPVYLGKRKVYKAKSQRKGNRTDRDRGGDDEVKRY